ncbi:MAG: gamma-glutamyl-gamma-aminobutyrate hydrolase family protein [Bacteroidales bacterium]|nr:gamma-glutamyl-gamma-aminobutyrate hydrolase family protein [Bacteroidales bacterium]
MKKILTVWVPITLFMFSILLVSQGCRSEKKEHIPLKIALTSASENYINWIHRIDSTVQIIDLKNLPVDSAIQMLILSDGVIFTGGEDVVPGRYGKISDTARCEMNPERDTLEFALIAKAFKLKIPVLGICRGQQLINVARGGSLVVDIPSDYPSAGVHRCEDYTRCFHHVKIQKETLLGEVTKSDTGWVTTNHHQAVASLGEGIMVSAHSSDGLPEAIEWEDNKGKSFFMAVQWHPERMDAGNSLSDPIGKAFLQACIIKRMFR